MTDQTQTEVAATVHGDVEYEVVTCSSCNQKVRKEDAYKFTIGDIEGWACGVCKRDGPLDYPSPIWTDHFPSIDKKRLEMFLLFPIALPLFMADYLLTATTTDWDDGSIGMALGGWYTVGWFVLITVVAMVLL
jgi:hypothetical protein